MTDQSQICKLQCKFIAICILHFAFCILQLLRLPAASAIRSAPARSTRRTSTTVYVPMIESDSYRRDLGERLTEAVDQGNRAQDAVQSGRARRTPTASSRPGCSATRGGRSSRTRSTIRGVSETELRAEVTWLNRRRLPIVPDAVDCRAAGTGAHQPNVESDSRSRANRSPRRSSRRSNGWPSRSSRRWKRRGKRSDARCDGCVRQMSAIRSA